MSALAVVRVGLVGCSKRKVTDVPARRLEVLPAEQLYRGDIFAKALRYARATCEEVYILSAHYGLLELAQGVRHYDVSLRELSREQREAWGRRVAAGLEERLRGRAYELLCLAGEVYAAALPATLTDRVRVHRPLRGLGLGEQKRWLVRAISAVEASR